MIIVPIKENESIDKALKKFKKKFERTGVVRELRRRQRCLNWTALAGAVGMARRRRSMATIQAKPQPRKRIFN